MPVGKVNKHLSFGAASRAPVSCASSVLAPSVLFLGVSAGNLIVLGRTWSIMSPGLPGMSEGIDVQALGHGLWTASEKAVHGYQDAPVMKRKLYDYRLF